VVTGEPFDRQSVSGGHRFEGGNGVAKLAFVGQPVDLSLLPARSASYAATFVFVLIIGGGLEEPGWRGFAPPRLQATRTPLRATLLLGALWGLWHVPLYGLGAIGPMFFAIPYTYLYNKTRSVLLCVLLHASFTPAQDHLVLLPKNRAEVAASLLMLATLTATAMIIILATRRRLGTDDPTITADDRRTALAVGAPDNDRPLLLAARPSPEQA